jgi:hypothetical protein
LQRPASVNLTTAAGDYSLWQYLGSGSGWRLIQYQRAGTVAVGVNPSTAALSVPAAAGADSSLVLQERTGSGGSTATLVALNGLTANRTFTLGDNGGVVVTDTSLRTELNASGSAPIYATRAWVNFNGTGTVAIRASGNVSSITDNGTGDYTLNMATALPDANYSFSCLHGGTANGGLVRDYSDATERTSSAFRFITLSVAGAFMDSAQVNVNVVR